MRPPFCLHALKRTKNRMSVCRRNVKRREVLKDKVVKKVNEFKPHKSQDDVFDKVIVATTDEGKEHVIVTGTGTVGGEIEAYEVKLNKEENTYSVEEREPTEQNMFTMASTSYTGWVKAITDDPVGVDLCSTKLTLSWYDYGSTIGYKSRDLSTWAANPSSLGTHWYVIGSTLDNYSLNSSKTQLTQKGYGYYRNYDFLDDDEETRVTHIISITAKNDGTYSYVVDWERWGESWITLDLDIETN
jgi:hypothetical protein